MVQYIDLEQQGTYEKLIKIEVDIVSDNWQLGIIA